MQNFITVLGIVIKQEPVGEFDRKIVLLTKEKGKITAYARGSRRQNNHLMAATNVFAFGEFKLFVNRNSYTLTDAEIKNYFEGMRSDPESSFYGMYFLEITDYYCRDGIEDFQMLKLLYQSLTALLSPDFEKDFVRTLFEVKAIMINGEFSGIPDKDETLDGTKACLRFLYDAAPEKIFSFRLSEKAYEELKGLSKFNRENAGWKQFKSLEMIEGI